MNNKKEILSELQSISPLLASISREPAYAVPEGYFDSVADGIFLKIEDETNKDFSKINVQGVPEGYFENLSDSILLKIKEHSSNGDTANTDEDKGIIPEEWKFKKTFSVPEGYFEILCVQILSKIKSEGGETELKYYPVLASLRNKPTYQAPAGYFDQLNSEVMEHVESKPAKVVPISAWWKYAAAAVVIGLVFLAAWPWLDGNTRQDPAVVIAQPHDLPLQMAGQFNTPEKIQEGIANLSDDAIAGYLADHGSILDNEFLIRDMEVQGMPDAMDYILQDDALGNYLDQLQNPG